jgi:DNA-binding response OmpR family regulator
MQRIERNRPYCSAGQHGATPMIGKDNPVVLVVEDDAALRTLFLALLTRAGLKVDCANDGAQAFEKLERRSYSVVLLDLMMPVVNGFDVLRQFSDTRPSMLQKTIVMTGVSQRELAKIDSRDVYAVLRKPFDIHALLSMIRACARSAEEREEREWAARGDELLDHSVRRFESAVPELRHVLAAVPISDRELQLRHELRRVVGKLGKVLTAAASVQYDNDRAGRYDQLGRTASRLAARNRAASRRNH